MSLQTEKKYKLLVLVPKDPTPADMKTASGKNKYWYINVPYYDESKKEWIDVPFKKGINYHKKFKDRLRAAHSLIDSLVELLEKGWNPISQTMPAAKLADPKTTPFPTCLYPKL